MTGTKENFEAEVLQSEKPVVLDFWAAWCSNCRMMGPIIDQIEKELGDRAKVVKIDADAEKEIVERYGVMSLPVILVVKNGEVVFRQNGPAPRMKLLQGIVEKL